MNWLHLLIDICICIPVCATVCYLLDKRREKGLLQRIQRDIDKYIQTMVAWDERKKK